MNQTNEFDKNCIFCKIVQKEIPSNIVYENDYVLAFLDLNPNADGHTLVIPKKHFKDLSSTDDFYLNEVVKAKKLIANKILNSELKPKGINYVSNQGSEAFQVVFHYHEHIIPKYNKQQGYTFLIKENEKPLLELNDVLDKIKMEN